MSSLAGRVRDAVNDIQQWLTASPNPGEAVVRQAIVLRLLQAAGFDIWNPAEVVPEETNATGNRADFLIRAGKGKFPLEIKGMNIALQTQHYQQVIAYAANEGTRWAMLTNGRVWVVLDRTHNPAGTFLDHEVLKLELAQEGHTFADDLATLLDAETWRGDRFAEAVTTVQQRQQQRRDEQRIQQEKRPVVEAIQAKYRIPTFELAAENAVEAGKITEAERDVLLGKPGKQAVTATSTGQAATPNPRRAPSAPMLNPHQPKVATSTVASAEEIPFTYRIKEAEAHAVYRPAEGTWTVLAGSTGLNRIMGEGSNARGLDKHRQKLLQLGQLRAESEMLLRYAEDVIYASPSMAAVGISGAPRNGWICWKDEEGRLAEHYRKDSQAD